jgi:hypothetical protein
VSSCAHFAGLPRYAYNHILYLRRTVENSAPTNTSNSRTRFDSNSIRSSRTPTGYFMQLQTSSILTNKRSSPLSAPTTYNKRHKATIASNNWRPNSTISKSSSWRSMTPVCKCCRVCSARKKTWLVIKSLWDVLLRGLIDGQHLCLRLWNDWTRGWRKGAEILQPALKGLQLYWSSIL